MLSAEPKEMGTVGSRSGCLAMDCEPPGQSCQYIGNKGFNILGNVPFYSVSESDTGRY